MSELVRGYLELTGEDKEVILRVSESTVIERLAETAGLEPEAGQVAVMVVDPREVMYTERAAVPVEVEREEPGESTAPEDAAKETRQAPVKALESSPLSRAVRVK